MFRQRGRQAGRGGGRPVRGGGQPGHGGGQPGHGDIPHHMLPLNRNPRVRNMIRLPAAPPNQQPLVGLPTTLPNARFQDDSMDRRRPRSTEFIESFTFAAATNSTNLSYLNLYSTVLNAVECKFEHQDEPSRRER
jgi:hypothetical protein